ncbi:hypothetical protein OHU45_37390 [Streptomyces tubercidicus]|uniref:hypothetical protein n=1 Tax=Streptomyces tubercidicus TaxID=47759 RepID=UPI0030DEE8A6
MTVESFIGITEAIQAGTSHITAARHSKARDMRPSDAQMERVRRAFRVGMPEYLNRRPIWAAAAPPALQGMFTEPTMQDQLNRAGRDLLTGIGFDVLRGGRLP